MTFSLRVLGLALAAAFAASSMAVSAAWAVEADFAADAYPAAIDIAGGEQTLETNAATFACEEAHAQAALDEAAPAVAAEAVEYTGCEVAEIFPTTVEMNSCAYTFVAAPSVTELEPDHGPASGGNSVKIKGADLGGASKVDFGATEITSGEFLAASATEIEVEAPAGAAGETVDVTVTTPGGTSATGAGSEYGYEASSYPLTINEGGVGSGTVECEVEGSLEPCADDYPPGTTVIAIASPEPGSAFGEWSGECDFVSGNECEVTLDAPKTIAVTFAIAKYALSVSKSGDGSGSVTSLPAGIDCGSTCSHEYDHGTVVTLSESAGSISEFTGWSGCDEILAGSCKVAVTKARSVTASFATRTHSLTIQKVGPGSGSVSCNGGACASSYPEGTTVSLSASANSGSTFVGWAGGGCSGNGSCVVTLNADTTVTAAFETNPPPPPPPLPEGTAVTAARAIVRGNKALIALACRGGGACKGVLRLYARLPVGGKKARHRRNQRKSRLVLIGKSRFSLSVGQKRTLKVRIRNKRALRFLNRGRTLRGQVRGSGVKKRSLKLVPKKSKRGKKKSYRHHKRVVR